MLIIGIPVSVISLICYCLCCSSSGDSSSNKPKVLKKKRINGQIVEQEEEEQPNPDEEDDEEYEERIVEIEPRFIENFVKPADARDIPTWPIMPDDSQKPMIEKKHD
jgi:hypothetical protein